MCCTSFHTAGTRARGALKWTPGVTSPAVLDIASRGNTRAPVCLGGRGAECNPCAQVRENNPSTSRCPAARILHFIHKCRFMLCFCSKAGKNICGYNKILSFATTMQLYFQTICAASRFLLSLFCKLTALFLPRRVSGLSLGLPLKQLSFLTLSLHLFISDMDPPRIKCPASRLKAAEPGKLTAVVNWDPPVASDTADKSLEYVPLFLSRSDGAELSWFTVVVSPQSSPGGPGAGDGI